MGGTAGVALVVLTAPASAPVLAVIGAGMAGGAVGMVIGGVLEKGISSADIARTLKTKYNIDVTERQNLDLDSLPSEVKDLCLLSAAEDKNLLCGAKSFDGRSVAGRRRSHAGKRQMSCWN